jgi:RNA polymerase sigma-70 factor, ECF subfamily
VIDIRWIGATLASSRASRRELDFPNEEAIAMSADSLGTEDLLERAGRADGSALERLLERHRTRLRRLVAARLDKRLTARVDPSDVVQETLADAGRRLPEYLRDRSVPYVAWLRRLALQRLIWWRRFHLGSSKRSVSRERTRGLPLSDALTATLVDRLAGTGTSPSGQVIRNEERAEARAALEGLAATDRQILELRYLEDLSCAEIAAKLGIGLSAVKMRHLRALERFRDLIESPGEELKG